MCRNDQTDAPDPKFPGSIDPRLPTKFFHRLLRRAFGDPADEQGLWYPPAVRKFQMPTRGKYANGFPQGAVVHFSEGRSKNGDADTENTIGGKGGGIDQGYCYYGISSIGTVYQSFLLDSWGWHAGPSSYPGLGDGLNQKLVGIEVSCAGLVVKDGNVFKPADGWNETFTASEVRSTDAIENVTEAGYYHLFSPAQEKALTDLILWMHKMKPDIFKLDLVVGHDEVATPRGRKQDPGASLSVYMPEFRAKLRAAAATS